MPFKTNPPLYFVWKSMRQRCRNPNFKQWKDYGGRGITICPRWDSYTVFAADMGERPARHLIDRIDNNGPYSPENCRWVTPKESQRNTRVARHITIDGESYSVAELAEKHGVKTDTIVARAQRGLPLDEVTRRYEDSLARARDASALKRKAATHCKRGHEFTPENTGRQACGRYCKACDNMRARGEI